MIRTTDNHLYTGITTDIQRRWQEHTSGTRGARYFRTQKPVAIALLETHPNRSIASKREAEIKKLLKPAKEALVLSQQATTKNLLPENASLNV